MSRPRQHWPSLPFHYWQLSIYYLAAVLGLSSLLR